MYKWQRIKALHAQGVSIRKIARTLGISRNTVRKYLKETNPPQFKARKYDKQLDRYREEIQAMLDKGYIGTRIHKELVKKGYNGSLSSVHRYLRAFKENDKAAKLATTRVETGPGRQMQYDWKEWLLPVPVKAERSEPGKIFVSSGGSMLVIFVLQWVNFICTKWVNSIDNQHVLVKQSWYERRPLLQ
ncbi:MAG: helix-turn-helix domain-containing protein [Bacillota bacterium]